MRNLNNILVGFDTNDPVYRVTRIDNGVTVNVDEVTKDYEMAETLMLAIVENLERELGHSANISYSPKNQVLGKPAKAIASFGNHRIEVGISMLYPIVKMENVQKYATNISYQIKDEPEKKSNIASKLLKKLFD